MRLGLIIVFLMSLGLACDARKKPRKPKYSLSTTSATTVVDDLHVNQNDSVTPIPFSGKRKRNHYKESYSAWTAWSRCSHKCKQHRSSHCRLTSQCGANMLREERTCFKDRCRKKIVDENDNSREQQLHQQRRNPPSEFRILYHLLSFPYSEWMPWSPCSKSCLTHRIRTCQMPNICGNKVLQEDALCYIDGSACEKLYNKKRRKRKKSSSVMNEADVPKVHPLNGIKCGVARNVGVRSFLRIIGGKEAQKGSWPWQATILNRFREPFCGGTLLSHGWILTAAHCVRRKLFVRVGEHDLGEDEGTEQESRVLDTFIHPDYDADTVNNDIALLQLKQPFELNAYCQPACLPAAGDELPVHAKGTIVGWGKRTNLATYGTDVLHEAEVPVVDPKKCKDVYENYEITDNMLCAGYTRGRVDSCAGDSGGPLLYKANDKWTVHGITSFGEGCGKKGKYGIYAKVSKFSKWIRKTIARYS